MENYAMLIGLVEKVEEKSFANGVDYADIQLKILRPFKNSNGTYDSDIFPIFVPNVIYAQLKERFEIGKMIGVRARLAMHENIKIVAEKIVMF